MKEKFCFLLLGFFLLWISACATTPQESAPPMGNPAQLVSQLETDLAAAKSNQVDVLAPGLYKDAQSALMKATQGLESGAKLSSISEYVTKGNASLARAEEIAQVSRTILDATNKAREKALKVGADQLGKPYMEVEDQYLKLTQAIENDNLSYAQKNAADVQAAFQKVEIMAIKNKAIGKARQIIADAENAKVQKIAPTAYSDAIQALDAADTYIGQNPYTADMISQKAAHAEFMAQRLMTISESSQKFKATTPEGSALYLENLLAQLEKALNTGDIRDQSVAAQVSKLVGTGETLTADNQRYQAHIALLEQRLSSLKGYSREQEAARQQLAAEREFNEQFNKVQRYFRPDEAEVYKQGHQLVIRMRGIKFPVGQATLTPENYTLLSKVQQAIQTFGKPMVTIEGHTDSTGSAKVNQELSQKRAEAVKTYLVANKTLPASRIQAAGYGPDKPLAPNTTPEGRAINRRIDVLITPMQAP